MTNAPQQKISLPNFDEQFSYLSDQEKEKVESFCADPVMVEAVRKVLLKDIYHNGTLRPGIKANPLTNAFLFLPFATLRWEIKATPEEIGIDMIGRSHGLNYVEVGFNELFKIKKLVPQPQNNKGNPAR